MTRLVMVVLLLHICTDAFTSLPWKLLHMILQETKTIYDICSPHLSVPQTVLCI